MAWPPSFGRSNPTGCRLGAGGGYCPWPRSGEAAGTPPGLNQRWSRFGFRGHRGGPLGNPLSSSTTPSARMAVQGWHARWSGPQHGRRMAQLWLDRDPAMPRFPSLSLSLSLACATSPLVIVVVAVATLFTGKHSDIIDPWVPQNPIGFSV